MRQLLRPCLLVVLVFNVTCLFAQVANLKCLDKPYSWRTPVTLDKTLPELNAPEGADILFEKQRVTFLRSKPELLSIVFERHVIMRFGTREAIEKHSNFRLPESFDPATDYQDVAMEQRDSLPRPMYFEAALEQFAGRIIGPQERAHKIDARGKIFYQRKKMGSRFFQAPTYDLELPGIAPGDTVEIIYKYIVPFRDNWFRFNSTKHYFNSDLYKHHYELQIDATRMQGLNLRGAPADSTAITKKKRYAFWKLKNLNACLSEVNARPTRDLPHVVYGTAMDSELYQHGHVISASLGGSPYAFSNIPYWVTMLRGREDGALDYRRLARKKVGSGQQLVVRQWLNQFGGVERSPLEKALLAHDHIAQNFSFQWDDAWFDDLDRKLIKHGNLLNSKTLREIGRYKQYSKILAELQLKYHTAYVQDKRAGEMRKDELTGLLENEYLFMLKSGEGAFFLHPKRQRGGYLVNEKPFYWEGTKALVADLDKLWGNADKKTDLVELPRMNPLANTRFITSTVKVGIDGSAELSANVLLNGQFSTMCRNAYLYGERDSTVMAKYGDTYFSNKRQHRVQVIDGPSSSPPYATEIIVNASDVGFAIATESNTLKIQLNDFFPFLVPEGFDQASRDLPFYWDFEQKDCFRVNLEFEEKVKVHTESVSFGTDALGSVLEFEISQTDERTVSLSAVLHVTKERVALAKAEELQDLFNQVQRLNRYTLQLKRVAE